MRCAAHCAPMASQGIPQTFSVYVRKKMSNSRRPKRASDGLMALRAKVPAIAPVSETPLAGKLRRHELGYKNVLDTLRIALANLKSDLAVMLARHLDRPARLFRLTANRLRS